jgi:hypothetical protein
MRFRQALALVVCIAAAGGGALPAAGQLPGQPLPQFGASVTGAFEGWFEDADGHRTFLVGYLNRNTAQALDIPVGPDNRIEPGGPDFGQPTHFLPGRQYGMFTVPVPEGFGPDDRLTWTLVANGQTTVIPLRLHPDYVVSPFTDVAIGNTPPLVRFAPDGPGQQGPVAALPRADSLTGSTSAPVALPLWASDDAKYASGTMAVPRDPPPPVEIEWSKYRGPGAVTFEKTRPSLETLAGGAVGVPFEGKAMTTARFTAPGDYILHVTATDYSGHGGGGEVCCWTTAMVKVSVTP